MTKEQYLLKVKNCQILPTGYQDEPQAFKTSLEAPRAKLQLFVIFKTSELLQ